LQAEGISRVDLDRLRSAGFLTVESVAFSAKKKLLIVKGISDVKADKLVVNPNYQSPTLTPAEPSPEVIKLLCTGSGIQGRRHRIAHSTVSVVTKTTYVDLASPTIPFPTDGTTTLQLT
jgi:hypothetical protein